MRDVWRGFVEGFAELAGIIGFVLAFVLAMAVLVGAWRLFTMVSG